MQFSVRLISLLFVLMAGLLITPVSAQKWVKYKDADCKCKIKFPTTPEKTKTEKDEATTYKVSAQVGDQTYFFGYTKHEVTMVDHENMAHISLEAFNEQLKGQVVNERPWEISKATGRQATINLTEQSAVCMYKVVLIGQMQYQAVVIAPISTVDKDGAKTFFDSFKPKKK